MAEDLQSILEKINRDGVERADREAKRIVDEAKAAAAELVAKARQEAEALRTAAEKDAVASAERSAETLRQAARDTVLSVEGAVTATLEKLLVAHVDAALSDPATVAAIAAEEVRAFAMRGEIVAPARLAQALGSQLAASKEFTVVTDETAGTGFTVKLENGRVEHSFTGETVARELKRRLRSDLAALFG